MPENSLLLLNTDLLFHCEKDIRQLAPRMYMVPIIIILHYFFPKKKSNFYYTNGIITPRRVMSREALFFFQLSAGQHRNIAVAVSDLIGLRIKPHISRAKKRCLSIQQNQFSCNFFKTVGLSYSMWLYKRVTK